MAAAPAYRTTRFLIVASLGFQVAALAVVMGLGTWGIHHMSRTEDLEFFDGIATIEAAHRLRSLAQREIILTRGRLLAEELGPLPDGPQAPDTVLARDYETTLAQISRRGDRSEVALVAEITRLGKAYHAYAERLEARLEARDRAGALRLHTTEGLPLSTRWLPMLDELIARRRGQIDLHHDEVNEIENLIKLAMLVAAVVTIPMALGLALLTARRVLGPLVSLEAAANAMGETRFGVRVPIARDDEFGHVARAFNGMAERVEASVETLRAANEELRRLDRQKDEILSIVSHELRTPLNAMSGFATLLMRGMAGPITDQQRQYATNIAQSSERMGRLVNDLLDLASLRLGKLTLDRAPTDYRMLVEDVAATMGPIAAEKDLALAIAVDDDAEPAVDYDRIAQVLTNLVGNAVKFTPRGGRVDVRVARHGDRLLTEVRDTGIGIAEADLPRLFQPFSQVDMGPARRTGGTGLGLSISKALVEAHGGEIGVRSEPDLGSTFWYALPL